MPKPSVRVPITIDRETIAAVDEAEDVDVAAVVVVAEATVAVAVAAAVVVVVATAVVAAPHRRAIDKALVPATARPIGEPAGTQLPRTPNPSFSQQPPQQALRLAAAVKL